MKVTGPYKTTPESGQEEQINMRFSIKRGSHATEGLELTDRLALSSLCQVWQTWIFGIGSTCIGKISATEDLNAYWQTWISQLYKQIHSFFKEPQKKTQNPIRICHLTFVFLKKHSFCVMFLITAQHIHNLHHDRVLPHEFFLKLNLRVYFKHLLHEKGDSPFSRSFGAQKMFLQ